MSKQLYYSNKHIDTISEDEAHLKNEIRKNMLDISKSTISLPFETIIVNNKNNEKSLTSTKSTNNLSSTISEKRLKNLKANFLKPKGISTNNINNSNELTTE